MLHDASRLDGPPDRRSAIRRVQVPDGSSPRCRADPKRKPPTSRQSTTVPDLRRYGQLADSGTDSTATAPDGDTSSTCRSLKSGALNVALTSMNSTKSMSESTEIVLETLLPLVGIVTCRVDSTGPVFRIAGTCDQLPARSTAALASTTPKPYSWLNS